LEEIGADGCRCNGVPGQDSERDGSQGESAPDKPAAQEPAGPFQPPLKGPGAAAELLRRLVPRFPLQVAKHHRCAVLLRQAGYLFLKNRCQLGRVRICPFLRRLGRDSLTLDGLPMAADEPRPAGHA
jgi:hypothetical protein